MTIGLSLQSNALINDAEQHSFTGINDISANSSDEVKDSLSNDMEDSYFVPKKSRQVFIPNTSLSGNVFSLSATLNPDFGKTTPPPKC